MYLKLQKWNLTGKVLLKRTFVKNKNKKKVDSKDINILDFFWKKHNRPTLVSGDTD